MAIQREKTEKTLSKSIINESEVNFCAKSNKKRENKVRIEVQNIFDATSRQNRILEPIYTNKGIKSARKVCLCRSQNKFKHYFRKNKSCRIVQGHLLKNELVQLEKNEIILTERRELWFPK